MFMELTIHGKGWQRRLSLHKVSNVTEALTQAYKDLMAFADGHSLSDTWERIDVQITRHDGLQLNSAPLPMIPELNLINPSYINDVEVGSIISVIKAVRHTFGLDLKSAKNIVEWLEKILKGRGILRRQ